MSNQETHVATVYLVGHPDSHELDVIKANSPQEAVEKYIAETGLADDGLDVWSTHECLPEIDVEANLDDFGADHPELSPIEESWCMYAGREAIKKLKEAVQTAIREHIPIWYSAEELLLELSEEQALEIRERLESTKNTKETQ